MADSSFASGNINDVVSNTELTNHGDNALAPGPSEFDRRFTLAFHGVDIYTGVTHRAPSIEGSQETQGYLRGMAAAGTGSSSNTASGPSPDVNNAPLDSAAQPAGNMGAGSSTSLPEVGEEQGWDLSDTRVGDWMRAFMPDAISSSTMANGTGTIDPRFGCLEKERRTDSSDDTMAGEFPVAPLAGTAQSAETMDAGNSINNAALPPVSGEMLGGEAYEYGQMGADNGAEIRATAQQTQTAADVNFMSLMGDYGQTLDGSSAIPTSGAEENVVAFGATLGDFEEQPVQMGLDSSANTFVAADATLDGFDQPQMHMGVDSSANNFAAPQAPFGGYAQQPQDMGASSSVNTFVAQDATFPLGGYVQQPFQMSAGSSAYNSATPPVAFGGYQQPQMQMGAGSSTLDFNAAPLAVQATLDGAMQQYDAAPGPFGQMSQQMGQQMPALDGSALPFYPQLDAPAQGYNYPDNGNMFGQQQLPIFNGNMQPLNTTWAAAPQVNAYDAVANPALLNGATGYNGLPAAHTARKRAARGERAASGSRRRRRAGTAPVERALAGPSRTAAPAVQPVAAQEGPYEYTAAGAPNRNPTKKGNQQGQVVGWTQAKGPHRRFCRNYEVDRHGCRAGCDLKRAFPLTWDKWSKQRFVIRWSEVVAGRPQEQILTGLAVDLESSCPEKFKVIGEYDPATGAVNKSVKTVHRVDKEMFVE
jgi:hypothetical protein